MARELPKVKNIKSPKVLDTTITSVKRGLNTLVSAAKIRDDEASVLKNMELLEEGLATRRRGTARYSAVLDGNIVTHINQYGTSGHLVAVAGGYMYKSLDDGDTWTKITGQTFTVDQAVDSVYAYEKLWIVSEDTNLSYYDGTSINTFTQISAPTNVGASQTGMSSGNYTYYYRVVAVNDQGQSLASSQASESVDQPILDWATDGSDYITVSWDAVTGATGYEIYRSTLSGEGELLDYVESQAVTSYKDYGGTDSVTNPLIGLPEENTTGGPSGTFITVYKDSLIVGGNSSRLYYSGAGDVIAHFNRKDGGGWIDINKDAKDGDITKAHPFQDTLLIFKERSIHQFEFVADTSIGVRVQEITSAIGCPAPRTIQTVENDVFFLSERGIFTIGNEPNFLNLVRTNELSARVRSIVDGFDFDSLSQACAIYTDNKYIVSAVEGTSSGSWVNVDSSGTNVDSSSVTVNSSGAHNGRTLVYDRERLAWLNWEGFSPQEYMVYYPNQGQATTLFAGGESPYVYEISDEYTTDDDDVIEWSLRTKNVNFGEPTLYKRYKNFALRMRNLSGGILVKLWRDATTLTKQFSQAAQTSSVGIGTELMGEEIIGGSPTVASINTDIETIKRGKLTVTEGFARSLGFQFDGNTEDSNMILLDITLDARPKSRSRYPSNEKIR